MLMHHIIRGEQVTVPCPRVRKKFARVMNISSWIWYLNKLNPDESKKYLDNIFKESTWEEDNENLHTFENFRKFVIDENVVKRQPSFVFVPTN